MYMLSKQPRDPCTNRMDELNSHKDRLEANLLTLNKFEGLESDLIQQHGNLRAQFTEYREAIEVANVNENVKKEHFQYHDEMIKKLHKLILEAKALARKRTEQMTRDELFKMSQERQKALKPQSAEDKIGEEVTKSLKRMLETMRSEVERSSTNISTARSTTKNLEETTDNYEKLSETLDESRGLINDLSRKNRNDMIYIFGALGVFIATAIWVILQRTPNAVWVPGKFIIKSLGGLMPKSGEKLVEKFTEMAESILSESEGDSAPEMFVDTVLNDEKADMGKLEHSSSDDQNEYGSDELLKDEAIAKEASSNANLHERIPIEEAFSSKDFNEKVTENPAEMPRIDPIPETPRIEAIADIPYIDPISETPRIESVAEKPVIEAPEEKPRIEPVTETPRIEPVSETPRIEPVAETPGIEASEEPPRIDPVEDAPRIESVEEKPRIEAVAEIPRIEPIVEQPAESVTHKPDSDEIMSEKRSVSSDEPEIFAAEQNLSDDVKESDRNDPLTEQIKTFDVTEPLENQQAFKMTTEIPTTGKVDEITVNDEADNFASTSAITEMSDDMFAIPAQPTEPLTITPEITISSTEMAATESFSKAETIEYPTGTIISDASTAPPSISTEPSTLEIKETTAPASENLSSDFEESDDSQSETDKSNSSNSDVENEKFEL